MKLARMMRIFTLACLLAPGGLLAEETSKALPAAAPEGRIASFFISEDLINALLKENLKSALLRDVAITLDPDNRQVLARGFLRVPTEDLRAVNMEPGLGNFRFQLAIQLKATRRGHLILIFPLDQTYFYPADSTDPEKDRVVVPVQLLSLALASARGQLAVLSGDFSGFDRKEAALREQMADLDRQLAAARDPDEKEALANDRKSLEIQFEAIPIERKQGEKTAKKVARILGFVGEKEINLNEELSARRNALVVRIQVGQLAPYLEGIELGGVRLLKDERDGSGKKFLVVDLNAASAVPYAAPESGPATAPARHVVRRPPDMLIRLNQALLESKAVVESEKQDMSGHIRNFAMDFKEDGIHVNGDWHEPLLPQIPFNAIVDFVWTADNNFEIRVREVKVAHINLTPLTRIVLDAAKNRLDKTLKGICAFRYLGEEKDHSRAIGVAVNMPALLPAFPKLALTGIRIKEKELILKAGQPIPAADQAPQN